MSKAGRPVGPSHQWVRAERIYHMPMAELLPGLVREHGQVETANLLRVSQSTISLWVNAIGGRWVRFILMPGEVVYDHPEGEPYQGPRTVMDD